MSLLLLLSCKKPKHGYWTMTLTDDGSSYPQSLEFYLEKAGKHFTFQPGEIGHSTLANEYGTINFDEKKKIITDGKIYIYAETQGHVEELIYTNFTGMFSREGGSGTYNFTKTYQYGPSTTTTGTGTFIIKWEYRKKKKEKD